MTTKFTKEPSGLGVHFKGLFVAMIYKQDKAIDGYKKGHYALAYNNGRYERYDSQAEARESALKIMAKTNIEGRTVIY